MDIQVTREQSCLGAKKLCRSRTAIDYEFVDENIIATEPKTKPSNLYLHGRHEDGVVDNNIKVNSGVLSVIRIRWMIYSHRPADCL